MSTPSVPAVAGDGHGGILAHGGQYVRHAVLTVFEALGGASGLETWVRSSEARKDTFYEKIVPKLITKQIDVSATRSVDDAILELDGLASPSERVPENVVDAEYEDVQDYD